MKHEHAWPRLPNGGVVGAVHALTHSQRVTFSVCNDCHAVKVVHINSAGVEQETIVADPFRRPEPKGPV